MKILGKVKEFLEERMLLGVKYTGSMYTPGIITSTGEYLSNENTICNSNVYTCVSVLADDIAKLPLQVLKYSKNGAEKDYSHPITKLLTIRSNPFMSAYTFKQTMKMYECLWGNAYAEIERDPFSGIPINLYPLDPKNVDIYLDDETMELWYVVYLPNGEVRKLNYYDVLHFKTVGNGYVGIPPITSVREAISNQNIMDKFLGSFYKNGTTTKGILQTPTTLKGEAKEKMRNEWQKLNSGLTNAHRIAILDAGLEYKPLSMPLKDAEFIEAKKFGVNEISKIFKVPSYKLGDLSKGTFNNVEQQSMDYIKSTLLPIANSWEQEIVYKLLTPTERRRYYVKFNFNAELRADSKTRAEYYEIMERIGAITINEIRDLEEMSNIGELGDKHIITLNYTTLENLEQYQQAKVGIGNEILKGGDNDENSQGNGN